VAAVLELDSSGPGPSIRAARLALGGVAHAPWRARRAEQALIGAPATREVFRQAAAAELEQARPVSGNEFKVPMAQGALVTVLCEARKAAPERARGPGGGEGGGHGGGGGGPGPPPRPPGGSGAGQKGGEGPRRLTGIPRGAVAPPPAVRDDRPRTRE